MEPALPLRPDRPPPSSLGQRQGPSPRGSCPAPHTPPPGKTWAGPWRGTRRGEVTRRHEPWHPPQGPCSPSRVASACLLSGPRNTRCLSPLLPSHGLRGLDLQTFFPRESSLCLRPQTPSSSTPTTSRPPAPLHGCGGSCLQVSPAGPSPAPLIPIDGGPPFPTGGPCLSPAPTPQVSPDPLLSFSPTCPELPPATLTSLSLPLNLSPAPAPGTTLGLRPSLLSAPCCLGVCGSLTCPPPRLSCCLIHPPTTSLPHWPFPVSW